MGRGEGRVNVACSEVCREGRKGRNMSVDRRCLWVWVGVSVSCVHGVSERGERKGQCTAFFLFFSYLSFFFFFFFFFSFSFLLFTFFFFFFSLFSSFPLFLICSVLLTYKHLV